MKYVTAVLFLSICSITQAQNKLLTTDTTLAIPEIIFKANEELNIIASSTSSPNDFDFRELNDRF